MTNDTAITGQAVQFTPPVRLQPPPPRLLALLAQFIGWATSPPRSPAWSPARLSLIFAAILFGLFAGQLARWLYPALPHYIPVIVPVPAQMSPIPNTPGLAPDHGIGGGGAPGSVPRSKLARQSRHLADLPPGESACTYLDYRVSDEGHVWIRPSGVADLACPPDPVHALVRRKVSGGFDAWVGAGPNGLVAVCCGPDSRYARPVTGPAAWFGNDGGHWVQADSVTVVAYREGISSHEAK